jgi:hypothetical protein
MFGMQRELSSIAAESDAQMSMFDQLGPKARMAFNYWPREPNVRTFMREFKMRWARARTDMSSGIGAADVPFDDPDFDAEFARYIHDQYFALTRTRVECLVPRKLQRPYRSRSLLIKLSSENSPSLSPTPTIREPTLPNK